MIKYFSHLKQWSHASESGVIYCFCHHMLRFGWLPYLRPCFTTAPRLGVTTNTEVENFISSRIPQIYPHTQYPQLNWHIKKQTNCKFKFQWCQEPREWNSLSLLCHVTAPLSDQGHLYVCACERGHIVISSPYDAAGALCAWPVSYVPEDAWAIR